MIYKTIVLSCLVLLSFFFFDVLACKGEELSATEQEQRLDANYNSILDTNLTEVCTTYDDKTLTCLTTKPKVEYLYISDFEVVDDLYEDVSARTFNSRKLVIDNKVTYQVFTGQPFIKVGEFWYQTETEFVDPEIFDQVTANKLSFLHTLFRNNPFGFYSVNAQVDPIYSNSGDGYIRNSNANWGTCRTAGTGIDNVEDSDLNTDVIAGVTGGTYYIDWIRMNFDTSALADDAVIATATLNVYVWDYTAAQNVDWVTTYNSITSLVDLENTDFDLRGFERYTDVITHGTENEWVTMTFTATATEEISLNGWTKLAITDDNDLTGVAPSDFVQGFIYTSFHAGTTYDPYLEITLAEEPPAQGTSTVYNTNCTPDIMNDLSMVNACSYTSSTTGVTYTNYHWPWLIWLIIILPILVILPRILTELTILLRGYGD